MVQEGLVWPDRGRDYRSQRFHSPRQATSPFRAE